MSSILTLAAFACLLVIQTFDSSLAFSVSMTNLVSNEHSTPLTSSSRRNFLSKTTASAFAFTAVATPSFLLFQQPAIAAPQILTTPNGIKYAVLKPAEEKRTPFDKDIVAVEYTGYLTDGTIFGTSVSTLPIRTKFSFFSHLFFMFQ
jgi:FKBP-type peptidyl-prolyl cis-trans isomerase